MSRSTLSQSHTRINARTLPDRKKRAERKAREQFQSLTTMHVFFPPESARRAPVIGNRVGNGKLFLKAGH